MSAAHEPITPPAIAAKTGKIRTLTAHAVALSVALLLGSAGVLKLSGYPPLVNPYIQAGQPYWVLYGSGFIECVCSIGLFIPRTRIYAAWGLLSMIFLVAWRPWSVHPKSFLLPQFFAISMLIVLVWPLKSAVRTNRDLLNGTALADFLNVTRGVIVPARV
jgi:uncharacterized membrane protein